MQPVNKQLVLTDNGYIMIKRVKKPIKMPEIRNARTCDKYNLCTEKKRKCDTSISQFSDGHSFVDCD